MDRPDDTTNYQVYRGVDRETSSQNAAVAATRLQGMELSGWDVTLWRLSHWYRQA